MEDNKNIQTNTPGGQPFGVRTFGGGQGGGQGGQRRGGRGGGRGGRGFVPAIIDRTLR